eukprot:1272559-Pyramimonas_sp.AAC.2
MRLTRPPRETRREGELMSAAACRGPRLPRTDSTRGAACGRDPLAGMMLAPLASRQAVPASGVALRAVPRPIGARRQRR